MEERDLNEQNDADRPGANERPNATGEYYDPNPDSEDVWQNEGYDRKPVTVPVYVENPVRTQQLPTCLGSMRTAAVPALDVGGTPVRLLSADPRRRRAVVYLGANQTLQLGATQKECIGPFAFAVASGTTTPLLLEFLSCDELWAVRATVETTVGVIEERWTG